MNKIEVSVIIPTHKRKDYLFYELEQIYKQKDVEFEIIVINDVEELDETDEIITRFPSVIYIKDRKIQGPSLKHKTGYKIAKGNYLYIPDDDDYLTDAFFFRKAVDILDEKTYIAFVSGQCSISFEFDESSKNYLKPFKTNVIGYIKGKDYLQEFQHKLDKPLSTVSTLYRKQAFDETDANNMIEMSDSSMYMQALLWGDAFIMDEEVAIYRIKGGSLTSTLSYDFIMNVLRQKELLYKKSRLTLDRPKDFWFNQYTLSYFFCPQKSKSRKLQLLLWGLLHSDCSSKLVRFCTMRIFKELFSPNNNN